MPDLCRGWSSLRRYLRVWEGSWKVQRGLQRVVGISKVRECCYALVPDVRGMQSPTLPTSMGNPFNRIYEANCFFCPINWRGGRRM